ncbi:PREDICTED: uncharacterized protein LOC104011607 [Nipponia nippon]|uniref:uncharacterized protein LOC104011607 n=1 Tax=Nipponia nippon TaxID=128390 RepID=UPI0005110831|nr:PREDICTED: uncharacterized protein LOC104011607 [Nipponia nippon]
MPWAPQKLGCSPWAPQRVGEHPRGTPKSRHVALGTPKSRVQPLGTPKKRVSNPWAPQKAAQQPLGTPKSGWPRITAFAESHRRRGLVSGVEAEGEQGQPEPTQIQPSAGAGSSDGGVNPDLRRQLGLILQTAGRSQVEKMLRELVREQGQGGKRRNRKKTAKDGGAGTGSGTEEDSAPRDGKETAREEADQRQSGGQAGEPPVAESGKAAAVLGVRAAVSAIGPATRPRWGEAAPVR